MANRFKSFLILLKNIIIAICVVIIFNLALQLLSCSSTIGVIVGLIIIVIIVVFILSYCQDFFTNLFNN